MACSHCHKHFERQVVDEGRHIYRELVHIIPRYKWTLCSSCLWAWQAKGSPSPVWLSHRWKLVCLAVALLYLAGFATICFAEPPVPSEEPQKLYGGMCYLNNGALSYPFICERYVFKGHVYWAGFMLDGTLFRIEEETPAGQVRLFDSKYHYFEDV